MFTKVFPGKQVRLTRYTDYSLRVLIHLALHEDRLCSIGEISQAYGISHNHLMKVANALARNGFIETVRGRGGGMRLARPPGKISVGEVVRYTEEGFGVEDQQSHVGKAADLAEVVAEGVSAMLAVFDSVMVTDLLTDRVTMLRLINRQSPFGVKSY